MWLLAITCYVNTKRNKISTCDHRVIWKINFLKLNPRTVFGQNFCFHGESSGRLFWLARLSAPATPTPQPTTNAPNNWFNVQYSKSTWCHPRLLRCIIFRRRKQSPFRLILSSRNVEHWGNSWVPLSGALPSTNFIPSLSPFIQARSLWSRGKAHFRH